eukprot:s3045_g8.t1
MGTLRQKHPWLLSLLSLSTQPEPFFLLESRIVGIARRSLLLKVSRRKMSHNFCELSHGWPFANAQCAGQEEIGCDSTTPLVVSPTKKTVSDSHHSKPKTIEPPTSFFSVLISKCFHLLPMPLRPCPLRLGRMTAIGISNETMRFCFDAGV